MVQTLLDGTEAMVEVLYHQIHFQEPHIEKRADTGQTSFNVWCDTVDVWTLSYIICWEWETAHMYDAAPICINALIPQVQSSLQHPWMWKPSSKQSVLCMMPHLYASAPWYHRCRAHCNIRDCGSLLPNNLSCRTYMHQHLDTTGADLTATPMIVEAFFQTIYSIHDKLLPHRFIW